MSVLVHGIQVTLFLQEIVRALFKQKHSSCPEVVYIYYRMVVYETWVQPHPVVGCIFGKHIRSLVLVLQGATVTQPQNDIVLIDEFSFKNNRLNKELGTTYI